jgi:DNA primase
LDVILLHQAGFTNTVSPMGTAINEDQLRLLNKFAHRVLLALDADAAGEKATLRGLELARNAMQHETELVFDAHGLLRHEARLKADVRVTMLPPGMDPDEVVLRDPEEWKKILESARPIVVHVMETLAKGQDLNDAKVKTSIASQVLPLIEDVPSPIERDTYRQQLARMLKVDERSLLGSQRVQERTRRRSERVDTPNRNQPPVKNESTTDTRVQSLEGHLLALLLHHTEGYYELERKLKLFKLEKFTTTDFENTEHQVITSLLLKAMDQDAKETLEYIQDNLPHEIRDRFDSLVKGVNLENKTPQKVQEDLTRTLINMRLIHMNSMLNQLRFLQEDPDLEESEKNDLQSQALKYTIARGKLDQSLAKPSF